LAGKAVTRLEDIQTHLMGENIGKSLAAKFIRGGEVREAAIVVGERGAGGE
jgi:S1-C subfamily serine protease